MVNATYETVSSIYKKRFRNQYLECVLFLPNPSTEPQVSFSITGNLYQQNQCKDFQWSCWSDGKIIKYPSYGADCCVRDNAVPLRTVTRAACTRYWKMLVISNKRTKLSHGDYRSPVAWPNWPNWPDWSCLLHCHQSNYRQLLA